MSRAEKWRGTANSSRLVDDLATTENELAAMTSRVVQLSEERIKQAAEFQSWMDENKAISTLRATLHATDKRLADMTTAKEKAVDGLKKAYVHAAWGKFQHVGDEIRALIFELEKVK